MFIYLSMHNENVKFAIHNMFAYMDFFLISKLINALLTMSEKNP
jgi:hypothetical protein